MGCNNKLNPMQNFFFNSKNKINSKNSKKTNINENNETDNTMNEMNELVKSPIKLLLDVCIFFCGLIVFCLIAVAWQNHTYKHWELYCTLASLLYSLLLFFYIIKLFIEKKTNKNFFGVVKTLLIILLLCYGIFVIIIIYGQLIFHKKFDVYYNPFILTVTLTLIFLHLAYYFACYRKALQKSPDINTTVNFGNILLTIVILILTIIQVVSLSNNKTIQDKESETIDKVYSQLSSYEQDNLVFTNYPDFAIVLTSPTGISEDDLEKDIELTFKVINMTNIKQEIDEMSISTFFMNNDKDYNDNPISCDCEFLIMKNYNKQDFENVVFEPYEMKQLKYTISCGEAIHHYIQLLYLPIYYSLEIKYDRFYPQGKKFDCLISENVDNIVLQTHTVVDFLGLQE